MTVNLGNYFAVTMAEQEIPSYSSQVTYEEKVDAFNKVSTAAKSVFKSNAGDKCVERASAFIVEAVIQQYQDEWQTELNAFCDRIEEIKRDAKTPEEGRAEGQWLLVETLHVLFETTLFALSQRANEVGDLKLQSFLVIANKYHQISYEGEKKAHEQKKAPGVPQLNGEWVPSWAIQFRPKLQVL